MRRISLLALLLIVLLVPPAQARRQKQAQVPTPTGSEQEVLRDFEKILDLWRDGRYADLYERTAGGKEGKERFARSLSDLAVFSRKTAFSWVGQPFKKIYSRLQAEYGSHFFFKCLSPTDS